MQSEFRADEERKRWWGSPCIYLLIAAQFSDELLYQLSFDSFVHYVTEAYHGTDTDTLIKLPGTPYLSLTL